MGEGAYDIAKAGGKHFGFYKNYLDVADEEIAKGIDKLSKQIELHQNKIADPAKYIDKWHELDPRQQDALVNKKWLSDIQRQAEQRQILQGLLNERIK